jgi:uncharacterized membrane protein YhdT
MRRLRRKKLRYGISSALIAFLAGWAVTTFLTPEGVFDAPRWQTTLWVYLGAHFVELSNTHTGGLGLGTVQPVVAAGVPTFVHVIPVLAVASAALYTCWQIHSSKIGHNVSNAIAAGMGYFLASIGALIVSDMRPSITLLLVLALLVAGGFWLGSTFVRAFSGGFPFIGIASFGTVAALGILLFLGGLTVAAVLWGVIVVSFGGASVAGFGVGVSRHLERHGNRRGGRLPRLRGLAKWVEHHWIEIIVATVVLTALVIGLSGNEELLLS